MVFGLFVFIGQKEGLLKGATLASEVQRANWLALIVVVVNFIGAF